jgi:hypothetical protein
VLLSRFVHLCVVAQTVAVVMCCSCCKSCSTLLILFFCSHAPCCCSSVHHSPNFMVFINLCYCRRCSVLESVPRCSPANLYLGPVAMLSFSPQPVCCCRLCYCSHCAFQPIYVHSKLVVVDDELLFTGSANMDDMSFFFSSELNLNVFDPTLAMVGCGWGVLGIGVVVVGLGGWCRGWVVLVGTLTGCCAVVVGWVVLWFGGGVV